MIEVLADDLVHFEVSAAGAGPGADEPLYTTPMVSKKDYAGPSRFTDNGSGTLATAALRLDVDTTSLCMTVTDTTTRPAVVLTTICPSALGQAAQSLTIAPNGTQHVYGLGEHFVTPGAANGDWVGQQVLPGSPEGNALTPFNGGNTANAQFPVMYALGAGGQTTRSSSIISTPRTGPSPATPGTFHRWRADPRLRLWRPRRAPPEKAYMELVGRPPVPPKKMFGLWVSQFGYKNWADLEDKLAGAAGQPLSGRWVHDGPAVVRRVSSCPRRQMGALTWDTTQFPRSGRNDRSACATSRASA